MRSLQLPVNISTHQYVLLAYGHIEIQLPFVLRGDVHSPAECWDGHCPAYRQEGQAVGKASVYPFLWKAHGSSAPVDNIPPTWRKWACISPKGLFPSNKACLGNALNLRFIRTRQIRFVLEAKQLFVCISLTHIIRTLNGIRKSLQLFKSFK